MADDNMDVMSLLTGGADARIMVKEFLKKYKGVILLIVLLMILGGWAWMASKGFSAASIAYTFLGAAIVAMFLINMIAKWMKGSTGDSGSLDRTSDEVLIDRRVKKQREIDELDAVMDDRAKKLRSDAKKITQAKKGQKPKKSKESTGDGHQS